MNKLLVLGGANVHGKLVEAANELGCYTIVTDYLVESPAKEIADESLMLSITDVDGITDYCKKNGVESVLSTHLDPGQRPYQAICERLGAFCYGTKTQFYQMTDKTAFKRLCSAYGVGTIPDYTTEDVNRDLVHYPVFIKPADSRGSRGQSVCNNKAEAINAIAVAQKESSNNKCIIEKYMQSADEVQVTYFFIDGNPYLIRTTDSYRGTEEEQLEKVVVCSVSPSIHSDEYLKNAHPKVVEMLRGLGIQNGPAFMQGFYDHGVFRFFDPGLRFPGVEYEKIYTREYDIDFMKYMVEFSLHGKFPVRKLPDDLYRLNGKQAAILFPTVKTGRIKKVDGVNAIKKMDGVVSYTQRHSLGGEITWTFDVNQRMAEIVILSSCTDDLCRTINDIQQTYRVFDEQGNDMIYGKFDVSRIGG